MFHVFLPIPLVVDKSVISVKIYSITILLAILPESLKDYRSFFIRIVIKKYQFSNSIKLSLAELSDINKSLRIISCIVLVHTHTVHFIALPVSCVLIKVFKSISSETFLFTIFQLSFKSLFLWSSIFSKFSVFFNKKLHF